MPACAARHTPTLHALVGAVGPTQFAPPHQTRQDGPVCIVSGVPRCELDDCSERVQISNFLSATVLSCRESNSHRRSGCSTDKTVLSRLAWRCELALTEPRRLQALLDAAMETPPAQRSAAQRLTQFTIGRCETQRLHGAATGAYSSFDSRRRRDLYVPSSISACCFCQMSYDAGVALFASCLVDESAVVDAKCDRGGS